MTMNIHADRQHLFVLASTKHDIISNGLLIRPQLGSEMMHY